MVSAAMRHVITPPAAAWMDDHNPVRTSSSLSSKVRPQRLHTCRWLSMHARAPCILPYWDSTLQPPEKKTATLPQVLFSVYLVYDDHASSRRDAATSAFALETLKAEVERLRLPEQDFKWAVQSVASGNEPALANAIAMAMRRSTVRDPTGRREGSAYLASQPLAAQLRANLLPKAHTRVVAGLLEVRISCSGSITAVLPCMQSSSAACQSIDWAGCSAHSCWFLLQAPKFVSHHRFRGLAHTWLHLSTSDRGPAGM